MLLIIPRFTDSWDDLVNVHGQDVGVDIHSVGCQEAGVDQEGEDWVGQLLREEGVLFWTCITTDCQGGASRAGW